MKKQSILSLVTLVAILVMTSCNKYEAKKATLKTQNDSLNYTLGLANGDGIKSYYMTKDSSSKAIITLMKAIDKAYKSGANKGEMYKLGMEVGTSFKQQKTKGLFGDSTLKFNEKLVKQAMINGLNSFKEGMTPQQAQQYIQKTMMKIQSEQMARQPQMPQQAPQGQPTPQPAK